MFNLTYFHIAAISTVPCTAAGASAYVGYQYYTTNSSSVSSEDVNASELAIDLDTKKLQLKNLENSLAAQESLLMNEEKEETKLKTELTHYEIALSKKTKANIEAIKDTYVADETSHATHVVALSNLTDVKEKADVEQKAKKANVDNKQKAIDEAEKQYQLKVTAQTAAQKAKEASDLAFTNAESEYSQQLTIEGAAKTAFDENKSNIEAHTATKKSKEEQKTSLTTAKNNARSAETSGKTACDEIIASIDSHKTCADQESELPKDEKVRRALAEYKTLKTTLQQAIEALNKLTQEIQGTTDQITSLTATKSDLQTKLDDAKAETKKLEQKKSDAQQKQAEDVKAYEAAESATAESKKAKTLLEQEMPALNTALTTAKDAFDKAVKDLNDLTAKTSAINNKYELSKKALEAIIGNITSKEQALSLVSLEVDKLNNLIKTKTDSLDSSISAPEGINSKSLEEINASIVEYKKNIATATQKIESINNQITSLKTRILSISSEIATSSKEITHS